MRRRTRIALVLVAGCLLLCTGCIQQRAGIQEGSTPITSTQSAGFATQPAGAALGHFGYRAVLVDVSDGVVQAVIFKPCAPNAAIKVCAGQFSSATHPAVIVAADQVIRLAAPSAPGYEVICLQPSALRNFQALPVASQQAVLAELGPAKAILGGQILAADITVAGVQVSCHLISLN